MKPRLTCIRRMGREKYGEGNEYFMIPSIRHHLSKDVMLWHGHAWLPLGLDF